jgi:hypothetical protein
MGTGASPLSGSEEKRDRPGVLPVENSSRSGNHRALPAPRDSMISMDDEAFTYNKRVKRLAII